LEPPQRKKGKKRKKNKKIWNSHKLKLVNELFGDRLKIPKLRLPSGAAPEQRDRKHCHPLGIRQSAVIGYYSQKSKIKQKAFKGITYLVISKRMAPLARLTDYDFMSLITHNS